MLNMYEGLLSDTKNTHTKKKRKNRRKKKATMN